MSLVYFYTYRCLNLLCAMIHAIYSTTEPSLLRQGETGSSSFIAPFRLEEDVESHLSEGEGYSAGEGKSIFSPDGILRALFPSHLRDFICEI